MLTFKEPNPALLLQQQKQRTVIIADLHLGWEVAFAEKGIHVPSQMPKLLRKLTEIIKQTKPQTLLVLGDIKHTITKTAAEEWRDIPDFFEPLARKVRSIKIIQGNHDGNLEPLLPETVEILPAAGMMINGAGFFHGHTWPAPELLKCRTLVMGHVHPVVMFQDPLGYRVTKQVWVKANINGALLEKSLLRHYHIKQPLHQSAKLTQCIIMPSFNYFLGGRPLNSKTKTTGQKYQTISPLLRLKSVKIEEAELFLLDGTFLGTIDQVRALG